jgi:general secretion pathway protein A
MRSPAAIASTVYLAHLGLREPPFAITPDPRYLYMSPRHREALAHLAYGVGAGGGFVLLTGEVGTGKTTICRCLLDQLPPEVDVALVLNPRLTSTELLATVCDELGIPYPEGSGSLKRLVDALHRHLLAAHGRGRRTVLVIDEAQNLGADVLEQVRLLTNLETTTEKLLQVILIGQPELGRLLARSELRQLAQRVTARYHLRPFSRRETRSYVLHRLDIAGRAAPLFTERALREVHRLSGGVPRLINAICDRALLGTYAHDRSGVDARTVRRAAAEVDGRASAPPRRRPLAWAAVGLAGVVALAGSILLAPQALTRLAPTLWSGGEAGPAGGAAGVDAVTPVADAAALPLLAPAVGLGDVLADATLPTDRTTAFVRLYARWGGEPPPLERLCDDTGDDGLRCLARVGTWNRLRRFNLPAVLELLTLEGDRRYAMVASLEPEAAVLDFGGRELRFGFGEVDRFWDGHFTLLWRPPGVSRFPIAPGQRGRDVEWLRRRLGEVEGIPVVPAGDVYDATLEERVREFQRRRALRSDGIVGEETLVHLSGTAGDGVPFLVEPTR